MAMHAFVTNVSISQIRETEVLAAINLSSISNYQHKTNTTSTSTTATEAIAAELLASSTTTTIAPATTTLASSPLLTTLVSGCPIESNITTNGYDEQMYVKLSTFWYCFLALITTLGLLVALVSNMIIIYLFTKTPYLRRNPSNIIAVNLSMSDLFYCIQWPSVIYCSLTQSTWILETRLICQTFGFLTVSTASASVLTVLAMSIERAIVIKNSIHAKRKFTIRGAWLIVVIIWLVSICSSLPPLFGTFNRYTLDPSKTSCTIDYLSSKTNYKLYTLVLYVTYWIVPTIIITICYIIIIVTFKQSSKDLKLVGNSGQPIEGGFSSQNQMSIISKSQQQVKSSGLGAVDAGRADLGHAHALDTRRQLRDSLRLNRSVANSKRRKTIAGQVNLNGGDQVDTPRDLHGKQDLPASISTITATVEGNGSLVFPDQRSAQTDLTNSNNNDTCEAASTTEQTDSSYVPLVTYQPQSNEPYQATRDQQKSNEAGCSEAALAVASCNSESVAEQEFCAIATPAKRHRSIGTMRSKTFQELRVTALVASHRLTRAGRKSDASLISMVTPPSAAAATTNTTCHIGASSSHQSRTDIQFRLAKTSFYLILLWLVAWTPIASLAMINSVVKCHHRASALAVFTANTMTKLGPTFDVFIYGISHPKIKSKFKQIIKWIIVIGETASSTRSGSGRASAFDEKTFDHPRRISRRSAFTTSQL